MVPGTTDFPDIAAGSGRGSSRTRRVIFTAGSFLAHTHAEITRHTYPGPAIAARVKQAVVFASMGERVEGVADKPHPGVADPYGAKFRKEGCQIAVELECAVARVRFAQGDPAAKQHALPVGGQPVVIDQFSGVGEDPVRRKQPVDRFTRDFFRRDHVGADRDQPPLKPGRQGPE